MRLVNVVSARLGALLRREAVIGDIDEELRCHLEMETEANLRRGMPPAEARRAALKAFGNYDSIRERSYAVRGGGMMEAMVQDARYAVRMLAKNSAFTVVAVLTLALGVGANTAIFSAVEGVLLRPLPYPHAERTVVMWERFVERDAQRNVVSPANFLDWRDRAKSFEEMALTIDLRLNVTGTGEPEEIAAQAVSPNFFELLGVQAALGRTFAPKDAEEPQTSLAILSHRLWQNHFGGSRDVIGKTVTLNGSNLTVIGVMPADFRWFIKENSNNGKPAEAWLPLNLTEIYRDRTRMGRFAVAFGRLAPGVTLEQAQAEMDTITSALERQYPEYNKGFNANLVPLREQLAGEIKPALLVLLGAVAFVLLIACVNVANLLLARAAGRHKEIAVRTSIGAGRGRIIRQLLTESLLLALLGGLLGLLLARWCIQALVALSPANLLGAEQIGLSLPVLAFTLAVTLLTGVVFGLAPALEASRVNLSHSLKETSRGNAGSQRGRRVRDLLILAEVGLALVLLVGAGLMVRSFQRLRAVDPGFDAANVLTLRVTLPRASYSEDAEIVSFFREAKASLKTLPGVQSVSSVSALPFADLGSRTSFTIEGRPAPEVGEEPGTDVRVVDEDYFRTMNIPLLSGRTFTVQEAMEDRQVVVINETMARTHFPN
ncbi:MAG TPA: ABC transporter permease, partial [Thermoanaerobaculia bacterium]|nr:ABC transporter permease [Thermoanaerobaculia bacterium]